MLTLFENNLKDVSRDHVAGLDLLPGLPDRPMFPLVVKTGMDDAYHLVSSAYEMKIADKQPLWQQILLDLYANMGAGMMGDRTFRLVKTPVATACELYKLPDDDRYQVGHVTRHVRYDVLRNDRP